MANKPGKSEVDFNADDALSSEEQDTLAVDAQEAVEQPEKYVVWDHTFNFEAREITRQQFAARGIDHDTVTWNAVNNWRVPLSQLGLSDDDMEALIHADGAFKVVD
jgi:hypothetical protein